MRIFLDANILFSAAKSDGAVRRMLRLLLEAGHECWVDAFVVAEARRNLAAKGDGTSALDALLAHLHAGPMQAHLPEADKIDWLPEKDRPVLAAAMRLGCQALVTGDRTHFGAAYGKAFGGVVIYSPRQLAETLLLRAD